ncbi:MAG: MFS transporter [Chloroflexota bacterium]
MKQLKKDPLSVSTDVAPPIDLSRVGDSRVLLGLMAPMMTVVLNWTLFSVAILAVREEFSLADDMTSWLLSALILAIMMFTPLYGSLGDGIDKKTLLLIGLGVFLAGSAIAMSALNLPMLMLGRAVQGMGSASVAPLSIALISELFPANERGKALGTWGSIAPIFGMVGPLLGGFLVDQVNWRFIYLPVFLTGGIAFYAIWRYVPQIRTKTDPQFLRRFDWGGVLFMSLATISTVFFVSSRPITGVDGLQDWRLFVPAVTFITIFIVWEKRQTNPFVQLDLFQSKMFRFASICAALWMFTVPGSVDFLMTLYLRDIRGLTTSSIGILLMVGSGAFMITLRFGGILADRWGSRWPVVIGSSVQLLTVLYFANLPETVPLSFLVAGIIVHGLASALSMAALHRAAMSEVSPTQMGMAAGLYSMVRFSGSVLGVSLIGALLQQAMASMETPIQAFQAMYGFLAIMVAVFILFGWQLKVKGEASA